MSRKGVQRRLAAILVADVVGYSRLVERDEVGAIERLKALRKELFGPETARFGGRTFKLTGDGALVEFPSASNAVEAAVAVQCGLAERNSGVPEDERISLRIGIGLGDVVVEGGDLYGNGVNIAARLQALADPGGICISDSVHEHIPASIRSSFKDAGEQRVRNIERSLRIWKCVPGQPPASAEPMAAPALPLPDRPSIAVLAFDNLSSDPEQDFFADGLAEDIITTLSKISSLFVIARNSSFTYKGKSVDLRQVGRELGVRYVLEGSVRAAGGRIRITAQLIDAGSGRHVWADRYDRRIEDIFKVQDEITREVVTALHIRLSDGEQAQLWLKGTESVEAWSCALPALDLMMQVKPATIREARALLMRAIEIDPNYAEAHGMLALSYHLDIHFGFDADHEEWMRSFEKSVVRTLELDPDLPIANMNAAGLALERGDYEAAKRGVERAVALGPSNAMIRAAAARTLIDAGYLAEAEVHMRMAMRLNPFHPVFYNGILANILERTGREGEAIELLQRTIVRNPGYFAGHLRLASLLALAGRLDEARTHAQEARRLNPGLRRAGVAAFYRSPGSSAFERFVDGLEKAGMHLE